MPYSADTLPLPESYLQNHSLRVILVYVEAVLSISFETEPIQSLYMEFHWMRYLRGCNVMDEDGGRELDRLACFF